MHEGKELVNGAEATKAIAMPYSHFLSCCVNVVSARDTQCLTLMSVGVSGVYKITLIQDVALSSAVLPFAIAAVPSSMQLSKRHSRHNIAAESSYTQHKHGE